MTDQTPMVIVDANQLRRERMGENILEAFEEPNNTVEPGGRYIIDGREVDANGVPLEGDREEYVASRANPAGGAPIPIATPQAEVNDEGDFADVSFADLKKQAEEMGVEPGRSRASAIAAIRAKQDEDALRDQGQAVTPGSTADPNPQGADQTPEMGAGGTEPKE